MKAPTLAAFAALIALYGLSGADAAISDAQVKKNCQAMTVCYRGGTKTDECTISNGACPPCVTFDNNGCYALLSTGCPFNGNSYDCTNYWGSEDVTSSASSSTGSAKNASSSEAGTTNTTSNSTSHNSHSSASGSSVGTAGSSSTENNGSDMSVVFAIIGAAIGVIAVAVIFLTLVRRSRTSHDDDDEMAATPPALNKSAPQSTTGAVTYASYNRANAANSTTGEPSVTSYYSQQPQNLPIQSPRVAGRAVPASPRVPAGRAAAVSAASQVPPQTAPAARALPMFANKATLSTPQQQQSAYQQQTTAAAPVYQQAPPTVQDPAARQATSPRSRRESYEF
ncbi:hypothetical protein FI667_g8704, partial [Globisporangium splendens]